MISINEYFVSSYLTPGATRDNFIFENAIKLIDKFNDKINRKKQ